MGTKSGLLLGCISVCLISSAAVAAPAPVAKHAAVLPGAGGAGGGGTDACGPYEPGAKLSYDAYMAQIKDLRDKGFDSAKLGALNSSLDTEMSRALVEVLSNANDKNTKVAYGAYTHAGSREKHFGVFGDDTQGANQDEGEGLRVIFKRDVKANDGTMRSVFVILFYKPKKDGTGFELIEGGDAIRVRSELAPARQGENGPIYSMAGLSYDVRMKDGKASSITAPTYRDEKGQMKKEYKHLQSATDPVMCNVCHSTASKTRLDSREFDKKDPLDTGDIKQLTRKLNLEFGAEKAGKLAKQLETPKTTFVPAGLLDLLKKRCGN